MPLDKSGSPQAFGNNVKREMAAGKPQNQAVAIAYSIKGERKPKAKPREKRFHRVEDYLRK